MNSESPMYIPNFNA